MNVKAVITGDLIHSRRHGPAAVEDAMALLAKAAISLSHQTGTDTRFTRHRGDGWQIYLDFPGLCLSATLQMAAALRAAGSPVRTRQSVGLGEIALLPDINLATAQGSAFEASGGSLDHMDKSRTLVIHGAGIVTPFQEAIFALADWHTRRWSREQAQAILMVLQDGEASLSDLASQIGISRQALQARLSTSGHTAWEEGLLAFESHDWDRRP